MKTRITMNYLPARPRQLDPGEMSKVFGGCTPYDCACDVNKPACCPGLTCRTNNPQNSMGSSTMSVMGLWYICWY